MKRQKFIVSISKLLIVSSCLIMVLFLGADFYFTQKSYEKTLEKEVRVKQEQMLFYVGDTVEQLMESIELMARSTANNYSIINNILNYKKKSSAYDQLVFQNNMNQTLSSLAYSRDDIVSVNILLDDDKLRTTKINGVYDYNHYRGNDFAEQVQNIASGWIFTKKDNTGILSDSPYIASYVLRIYSGLYYGDALGHLVINVKEEFFYDLIQEYSQDQTKIFLLNEDGEIVSTTERELLGEKIQETEYEAYGQVCRNMEPAAQKEIEDSLGKKAREEDSIFEYTKLKGREMYILSFSDYSQALLPIKETQKQVMGFDMLPSE